MIRYYYKVGVVMKYYIEVGSTVTKCDKWDGKNLTRVKETTILFKKNYQVNNSLNYDDVNKLIDFINCLDKDIPKFIYGTSIFRKLSKEDYDKFFNYLKEKTGLEFNLISQEDEGKLTALGASHNAGQKVCVMIGGGGSTEILVCDNEVIEAANSNIGVIDVLNKFPDLGNDIATTDLDVVIKFIKEKINLPKNKADILVLAGGGHEKFARLSGISYTDNTLYKDVFSPIMMDTETRRKDTIKYFKEISLDNIKAQSDDPDWWNATRAMCAFVLLIADEIGAKYIVPTDIAIAHGIIATNK